MQLQRNRVEKPLRKLSKQLKSFPADPLPEKVHSLRTRTRRLEATIAAVSLDREKKARRLVKRIKPLRKAAGAVRDMDVLIGDVLTVCGQGGDSAVRLVQHLSAMRVEHARRLHHLVGRERGGIRRQLEKSSKLIRNRINGKTADGGSEAATQILITELSHWPKLEEGNLHLFRIRLKELRYMLQLHEQADEKLVDALGEVKDIIGEWHDWLELANIAREVLDPKEDRELLNRIFDSTGQKFQIALEAANRVRARYLPVPDGRKSSRKILPIAS